MALGPGLLWNRRVGQRRLGCSSLGLLTGLAAASGCALENGPSPRGVGNVITVMKLLSNKKKARRAPPADDAASGRTGASGTAQRGLRPHCGAAPESGVIGGPARAGDDDRRDAGFAMRP